MTDVTGTVRYKGKALKGGTIPSLGSDGAAYPARIGPDGTYRVRVRGGDAQVLDGEHITSRTAHRCNPALTGAAAWDLPRAGPRRRGQGAAQLH
jgi:hypothetical protein